ncbi:MAG: ribosome biogenesis GTPase Der [Bacteroidota bacterium]
MSCLVAIVGRPNVGKSTFFNRLIGERKAIIDDVSGVTRDRIYGHTEWNGRQVNVVDTGGFVSNSDDIFEAAIRSQVQIAIDEADVIVFMVDVTTGITDLDESVAHLLRSSSKRVVVAVNKVDNSARMLAANEFWSLGFDNTFFLSSMSGSGSGDLLDAVIDLLPPEGPLTDDADIPRLAILGRPNVGKSSFVNALLGEDRNIVTDIAGTTRDAIHSRYTKFGKDFILIDTAGIRKKKKVHEDLEFYSVIRAIKSIDETDICILMIDATQGLEAQDMSIFSLILKRKRGVIILVNKWDLIEKETNTSRDYEKRIREKIAPFTDVPILFISALEKQRIFKAVEVIESVYNNKTKRIKTSALNEALAEMTAKVPPPAHRGRLIKIKYVTQLPTKYPAFAFFCNHPKHVKENYRNYLENQLRQRFDFTGVPIAVVFKEK